MIEICGGATVPPSAPRGFHRAVRPAIAIALAAAIAGCASAPRENAALERARSAVAATAADTTVSTSAQVELQRAQQLLRDAERAWTEDGNDTRTQHLAYLAERQASIARENAKLRTAQETVQSASAERDRVVLEVREREVDRARASAAQSQLQAEAARRLGEAQALQAQNAAQVAAAAQARNRQLEARYRELQAEQTARGMVVTLGDVLFDVGRAELKPNATRQLDRLAEFLREFPERSVRIEGHTDSTGSDTLNQALSEERANAVRSAIVTRGIAPDRVVAQGFGEATPVADNTSAGGRALNRRVEVVISDDQGRVAAR